MTLPSHRPRPLTIFEAEDPTLDPEAISHALPPRDKLVPGALSLLLYGTLVAGLVFWPDILVPEHKEGWDLPSMPQQRLNIILEPSSLPVPKPGPQGGGEKGTGSLAPFPLSVPQALPEAELLKTRESIPQDLNPVLDVKRPASVSGGNGRSPGSGPGSGGGTGGGTGWGSGRAVKADLPDFDFQLKPVKMIRPNYTLRQGQAAIATTVVVRVTIEEDGRVSSAKAVEGPEFLWSNAENNALCWLFEPLAQHGLKAPQVLKIAFHYTPTSFRR